LLLDGIYSNASKLREGLSNLTSDAQQAADDEVEPRHDFKKQEEDEIALGSTDGKDLEIRSFTLPKMRGENANTGIHWGGLPHQAG
jgi:hypothetical protein